MRARDCFFKLGTIHREITLKEHQREKLWSLVTGITVSTDGDRVQTSGSKDKVGSIAALIADLDTEIAALEAEHAELTGIACGLIRSLDDVSQYDVLFYRFIKHQSIEATAELMQRSTARVKQLQRAAILQLESQD